MSELISRQKLIEELESLDKYFVEALPLNSETVFIAGEVRELIESQPPADQWIPVTYHEATEEEKEAYGEFPYMLDCKLPDDGEEILVCTKSGCVWTDTFFNDDGCYLDGGYDLTEIAAWQPLPKPYKGE